MNLGFIGLGSMGGAIARRLVESHTVHVHDVAPRAVDALAALGATPKANPAEVAASSDMVMTCLPTSTEVRAVVFGDGGLLEGMPDGGLIADMTTGDPVATRDMAAQLAGRGVSLIDAPVSGGPDGAAAGTLAIIVGAPDDLFETWRPVFASISPNVFHAGGVGAGHTMKLVNNTISAGNRAIALEAVSLAVKNGIDPKVCIDIVQKSSGRSYVSDVAFPNHILTGTMQQGFTIGLMLKDLGLSTQLGRDSDVPMRLANVVREMYEAGVADQGRDADISELLRLFESAAGVTVVPKKN